MLTYVKICSSCVILILKHILSCSSSHLVSSKLELLFKSLGRSAYPNQSLEIYPRSLRPVISHRSIPLPIIVSRPAAWMLKNFATTSNAGKTVSIFIRFFSIRAIIGLTVRMIPHIKPRGRVSIQVHVPYLTNPI